MRAIILVPADETGSANFTLGGETITVAPGSCQTLDLSTGDAIVSASAKPAPTDQAAPPAEGDTGAKVVADNAPASLQTVADALGQTNAAVGQMAAAVSDHIQASADIVAAQGALDDANAALGKAETDQQTAAAADQVDAATQQLQDAQTALQQAATAHAAAADQANDAAAATAAAADKVHDEAEDPAISTTQAHSEQADQMANAAAVAVDDAPPLPPAPADPGTQAAGDGTQTVDGPQPTADAVVSTDPDHGATPDAPVVLTQASDGTTMATPVVGGTVTPGSVVVAEDGSPSTAAGSPAAAVTFGDTAPAPEGTPTPTDAAAAGAQPVGALQAADGTDSGAATPPTIRAVLQHLVDQSETSTHPGDIALDDLNAALTAAGFDAITPEDHASAVAAAST